MSLTDQLAIAPGVRYDCSLSTLAPAARKPAFETSWVIGGLLSFAALLVFWPFGQPPAWQDSFAAYFISIVLQSVPYILLGALIAALAERFLPSSWLPRLTARLGVWGIPAIALLSPIFPSCECGVVSVGRSLMRKGLPLPHTLTYLLAAPILNPTVLLTTWMAFQDYHYPLLRGVGGFVVAVAVGLALRRIPLELAFRPEFLAELRGTAPAGSAGCCDDEDCETGCAPAPMPQRRSLASVMALPANPMAQAAVPAGQSALPASRSFGAKFFGGVQGVALHIRSEFLEMVSYFLFGVFIAAAMKTFIPTSVFSSLSGGFLSGPLAMMLTAFILSLCAEADAFPAASFTHFNLPSHMAFLVLGPMLDIKLLLMYRSVFRTRFIAIFAATIILSVLAYALLLQVLT